MLATQYAIIQKEVKCNPKRSLAVKKVCGPQEGHCEKRYEIQGVSLVMVG